MSGINKVILIGNLGHNPDIRLNKDGTKIATFSVATKESWEDKQTGQKKEKVEWHKIVVFNKNLADIAEKYLKKGSKVYIEGSIQSRKWDDKGVEKTITEIVLTQFKGNICLLDKNSTQENNYDTEAPF